MKLSLDGVLARRIVRLSAPVVGAMISQTLINVADHVMIGRLPAEESVPGQSAAQLALMLLWVVGGSLSAIGVGTQAMTARRYGAGDPVGTGRVLANAVAVALLLGALASIVFVQLAPALFYDHRPTVRAVGVPFLQFRYASVVAMVVTASYKAFFDGLGKTYVHFIVALVMNVLNLVLNFALIFGMFGFKRMGVPGSGLASCISSYLGMVLIIAWSLRGSYRRFHFYRLSNLSWKTVRELVGLAAPSTGAVLASMSGFLVFYEVVKRMDIRAGNNVTTIFTTSTANLINIMLFVSVACIAYGQAIATLVGQSLGEKKPDLAARYANEAAKIGFSVFFVLGIVTSIFPHHVLHLWTKDAVIIETAAPILRVLALFMPLMCVALVFTYALYGAGNSRFVMYVELSLHFSCLIPISYLLGLTLHFGLWGVWSAMIVYVVLIAGIMSWKFSEGSWKHIRI